MAHIIEGTWDEIKAHEAKIRGHKLRLEIDPEAEASEQPDGLKEFQDLVRTWRRDTAMLSSSERKAVHPAYQSIIGMGQDAVPLILNEMKRQPDHWFWALRAITGANPARQENVGDVA